MSAYLDCRGCSYSCGGCYIRYAIGTHRYFHHECAGGVVRMRRVCSIGVHLCYLFLRLNRREWRGFITKSHNLWVRWSFYGG